MDSKKEWNRVFQLISEHGPDGARKRTTMPKAEFKKCVDAFNRKHFKDLFISSAASAASSVTLVDDKGKGRTKKREKRKNPSDEYCGYSRELLSSSCEGDCGSDCGSRSSGSSDNSSSSDSDSSSDSSSEYDSDSDSIVINVPTTPITPTLPTVKSAKKTKKTKKGGLFCGNCKIGGHNTKTCLKTKEVKKTKKTKTAQPKAKKQKKKQETAQKRPRAGSLKTLTEAFNELSKNEKDAFLKLVY
jgi:hypothetical protein